MNIIMSAAWITDQMLWVPNDKITLMFMYTDPPTQPHPVAGGWLA